jgi:hypothetical protein
MILEWLCMGFGLVSGFIGHLQNVTTVHIQSSQFAMSSPVITWWQIPTMSSASVLTFLPAGDCLTTNSLLQLLTFKSKSYYKWWSVGQSILVSSHICGPRPDFYYSQLTVLLITSRHELNRKHHSSVAVQTCLFAKTLLSNGCCMFAYLMVIAQQRVQMPQYIPYDWLVYRCLYIWYGPVYSLALPGAQASIILYDRLV